MKKHHMILGLAILLSAAIVAGAGAYLKYEILKPLDLYQDKSIFELPFLMHSDDFLRFMVENADELLAVDPTEPSVPVIPSQTKPSSKPTVPSVPNTAPSVPVPPSSSVVPESSVPSEPPTTTVVPPTTTVPPVTTVPPTTTQAPTTVPPVTNPPKPVEQPNFDFPSESVDSSWFDNTLFIGDSRVVGLRDYARSGNADYFCDVGMTVFSYKDKQLGDKNFPKQTLESLLSSKQYDKIFINFGLNEAGYPINSFKLAFNQFVQKVRQLQPNAKIILQGIMSVTRNKAAQASYFSPSHLRTMSAYIQSLADGISTFYVDCNPYFADSEGYLFSSLTNDGYHPTGSGYRHWRDWIGYIAGTLGI